eukprot:3726859-Rhodomonas_salina.1
MQHPRNPDSNAMSAEKQTNLDSTRCRGLAGNTGTHARKCARRPLPSRELTPTPKECWSLTHIHRTALHDACNLRPWCCTQRESVCVRLCVRACAALAALITCVRHGMWGRVVSLH